MDKTEIAQMIIRMIIQEDGMRVILDDEYWMADDVIVGWDVIMEYSAPGTDGEDWDAQQAWYAAIQQEGIRIRGEMVAAMRTVAMGFLC